MSSLARRTAESFGLALLALAGGAATALLAVTHGPQIALGALGVAGVLGLFLVAPWTCLPVVLLGGTLGQTALGAETVTEVSSVRLSLLLAGCAAVGLRRLGREGFGDRVRTPADLAALVFAAYVTAAAAFGLARGNDTHEVVVTLLQLVELPLYFFLATFTLNTRERLHHAALLFCAGALLLAGAAYLQSGRQGGILSSFGLAAVLAMGASGRLSGFARLALVLAGAVFLADVVLSAYRTVWVAGGVTVVGLAVFSATARRTLGGIAVVLTLAALSVAVVAPSAVDGRLDSVREQLGEASGYREAESRVGLEMVADAPLIGQGLGRMASDRYLETLGYADVGPIFHAFWLTVSANLGLVGLVLLLGLVGKGLAPVRGAGPRNEVTAMRVLLGGWMIGAAFAGPTDGHWELGLLPALALLAGLTAPRGEAAGARVPDSALSPGSPTGMERGMTATLSPSAGALVHAGAATVSAVVVSYRSASELPRCLPALLRSCDQVIVVDNASGDGSAELAKKRFPEVELVCSATNDGFAAANNLVLERVRSHVTLLVNPDCEVLEDAPRTLASYLAAHPRVGVAGPAIEDEAGRPVASAHRFETAPSVLFLLAGGRTLLSQVAKRMLARLAGGNRSYEVNFHSGGAAAADWVSGACLAVRTDLLRELGGLDEGYFMYMEDEDLCRRAGEAGAATVRVPSARARHTGGASSGDRTHVWVEFYRSLLRFQAKSQPRTYPLVRAAVVLRSLLGMALGTACDNALATHRLPRERRALAWARILRLAVRASRHRALLGWREQTGSEGRA